MYRKIFLTFLFFYFPHFLFSVDETTASTCLRLNAVAFRTWHVDPVPYMRDRGLPVNGSLGLGIEFSSRGRIFVLPSVTILIESSRNSNIQETYTAAVKELRSTPGSTEFLRIEISDQIIGWASNLEHSHDLTNQNRGLSELMPYQIPDGRMLWLSQATRDILINQWALRFRPGDM